MREIFALYLEGGRSVRQIAYELKDRTIPSPAGKPIWGPSTIQGLLRNEAYIGTVYYNRREAIEGNGRRGQRTRKTRYRERPRDEWIAISVPVIIDPDTYQRVQQVSRENSRFNPRGVEPGRWLLRGLVVCGHCDVGCNCQKMRGRPGHSHHYYNCRNHDLLRAGSEKRRCPERNIRADELDTFVFEQIRQALTTPEQLIAGEHAVIANQPQTDDELLAAQLQSLDRKLDGLDRERTRLLDAYQAELINLDELTRRTSTITARRDELAVERDTLREHRTELAERNQLRHRLAGFAEQVVASLANLDFDGRQRLLRAVIEKVTVTGSRVEIHLKIPLTGDDDTGGEPTPPPQPQPPSTDDGLRSLDRHRQRELALPPRPRTPRTQTNMTPAPEPRPRLSPLRHPPYGLGLRDDSRGVAPPGNQATSTPTTTDARWGHFKPSRRGQCKPSFSRRVSEELLKLFSASADASASEHARHQGSTDAISTLGVAGQRNIS